MKTSKRNHANTFILSSLLLPYAILAWFLSCDLVYAC